ncbi:MAG: PTS transporter subunit EIIC, partial [Clostridiaceae bacterium]
MKNFLQKLGKSLMLPISVLPVVSILFGIGYAIDSTLWGHGNIIAGLMIKSGLALIDNIPILFAVGIPVGLSKERDGVSALSGLVGFLIIQNILNTSTLSALNKVQPDMTNAAFGKINNVFIGILVGILVSLIYDKFSKTELPSALSFFSGRRLIPIITVFTMIVVSVILYFIWPALYNLLVSIGESISSLGAIGAGIYGFLNRLLIPTGLHHALNAVFWFDTVNINDLGHFWANVGVKGITGRYMSGFFPIMMFGLPGACLAIYSTALEKHKKSVGSMLIAVSFSAFLVGLTEPIEFLFMFLSPLLYIVHALLTAISMFIAATMHWTAGFNFSAGLIDWVLSSGTPMANHPEMLLVLGLVMFVVYFIVFRTLILKLDL